MEHPVASPNELQDNNTPEKDNEVELSRSYLDKMKEEMQGGMRCRMEPLEDIPLRQGPLRFAVYRQNGLTSNSWRVWIERQGDVYIACRDNFQGMKISLHKSGKCHIANEHKGHIDGDRYMGTWFGDVNEETLGTVAFRLLFPSPSLYLNQEKRDWHPKIWNKNRIYIESPEPPFGTIITFAIVKDSITHMDGRNALVYPLAVLPAWPGTRLWVIVSHDYEARMLNLAYNKINEGFDNISEENARVLEQEVENCPSGKVIVLTISGAVEDGGRYLLPFPIEIRPADNS